MPETLWVLFDVGGVLEVVDDEQWPEEWWRRWGMRAGLDRAEIDARLAAAHLPDIETTTGRGDEFWRGLALTLGLDARSRAQMCADFWDSYCGKANQELLEYARSLAGRARTAILSNSVDGAREEEDRRFGFSTVFDPICYSHELGVGKPDPEAYRLALARLGADPEDVFFIDDHSEMIDGAAAVGIRGVVHRDNRATIAAIEEFLAR